MKIKKSIGSRIFDIVNVMILSAIMIISIYPMLYVLFASFSDSTKLLSHVGLLFKSLGFNFNAYKAVFTNPGILSGYAVTIFIVIFGTFLDITMTSIAAFVLSRRDFMFRKFLTLFVVFTMYFSGGLIPRYLWISSTLHMSNSLWALMLPGMISVWSLLIMRTNFDTIPKSLEESVKIDGATDITVFLKIIIPLSKPILAVMILMYAVGRWNSWFDSFLFIRDRALYPLQIILREILIASSTESMLQAGMSADAEAISESIKYATIIVATTPILCIYPFIQKYFTKGLMLGAVKG